MSDKIHEKMLSDMEGGATCLANLEAILSDNGSGMDIGSLARGLYRYTDCGAWLSVMLHDGTWKHSGDHGGVTNDNVRSLLVGSIVEGSDAEVKGEIIDLLKFDDTGKCVTAFWAQVDAVNAEACALWEEAQGEDEA